MRIFQLNTFCGVKSTGRIANEIAKLVVKDGGVCRIGYGVPEISEDSEAVAYRIGSVLERKVHAALRKLFDAEGYGSWFATRKLIQELKTFQPDLIHLHNLHGCYLHLPTLFRFLNDSKIPIVWTLHDCWPFTGHCAYFDYCGCDRWVKECHDCPQKHSYPVCTGLSGSKRNHRMKKRLFANISDLTFVAPCEWMIQPLSRSFLKRFPVRTIPNGVNLTAFRPTPNNLRERFDLGSKKICLAVASEWDERKGLVYLVKAAEELGREYQFVVIGLTAEQLSELPQNILGFERTANMDELAQWYTVANCFVNPTLEDNMPMVNLEALACGTPVAVFRTGGCPEAIDDGCGIVVEQGDLKSLCSAIQILSSQKNAIQNNCIERAKQFNCEKTFQSYLALYKELCK